MTDFDFTAYQLALSQTRSLDLSWADVIFDPGKHPRLHGKFVASGADAEKALGDAAHWTSHAGYNHDFEDKAHDAINRAQDAIAKAPAGSMLAQHGKDHLDSAKSALNAGDHASALSHIRAAHDDAMRDSLSLATNVFHPGGQKNIHKDLQTQISGLSEGEHVHLPDGTRITNNGNYGYTVNSMHRTDGGGMSRDTPAAAATTALLYSAASSHPDSWGGTKQYASDAEGNAHTSVQNPEPYSSSDAVGRKAVKNVAAQINGDTPDTPANGVPVSDVSSSESGTPSGGSQAQQHVDEIADHIHNSISAAEENPYEPDEATEYGNTTAQKAAGIGVDTGAYQTELSHLPIQSVDYGDSPGRLVSVTMKDGSKVHVTHSGASTEDVNMSIDFNPAEYELSLSVARGGAPVATPSGLDPSYAMFLAQARQQMGLDLSWADVVFDAGKHPRLHGKFTHSSGGSAGSLSKRSDSMGFNNYSFKPGEDPVKSVAKLTDAISNLEHGERVNIPNSVEVGKYKSTTDGYPDGGSKFGTRGFTSDAYSPGEMAKDMLEAHYRKEDVGKTIKASDVRAGDILGLGSGSSIKAVSDARQTDDGGTHFSYHPAGKPEMVFGSYSGGPHGTEDTYKLHHRE